MKYTIICHVCVELNREETVHLVGAPWAKACREHRVVAARQRYVTSHPGRVATQQRRYNTANRDKINEKERERRRVNRDAINQRRRERYAARKKAA